MRRCGGRGRGPPNTEIRGWAHRARRTGVSSPSDAKKGGDRARHSITATVDMRRPHGAQVPPTRRGPPDHLYRHVGLTLYHAGVFHVNGKPLRGGYHSTQQMAIKLRASAQGTAWGYGRSLYCKPSQRRTASIRAAPQPQISRVSSCSRSSSGSRCLSARRAFLHMPV